MHMPQLVPVPPRLIGFASCKAKDKAIIFPSNVEEVSKNNALGSCHQVLLQCQKTARK
jgi:hypothetical protein